MLTKTIKFEGLGIGTGNVSIDAKLNDVDSFTGEITTIESIDPADICSGSVEIFEAELSARDWETRKVSITVSGGSLILYAPVATHRLRMNDEFPFFMLSEDPEDMAKDNIPWANVVAAAASIAEPPFTEEQLAFLNDHPDQMVNHEVEELLVTHYASIVLPGAEMDYPNLYSVDPRSNVMIDGNVATAMEATCDHALYEVNDGQTITFDLVIPEQLFKF